MIRPVLAALALCAALPAAAQSLDQPRDQPLAGDPAASGPTILAPDRPAATLGSEPEIEPEPETAPETETDRDAEREARSITAPGRPAAERDGSGPARACTARVIGLRPLSHYDHAQGSGFLAVREGPGSTFPQIGELYLGDTVTIGDRRGNWYAVRCSGGLCATPLWGQPAPEGWAYGRFLHLSCPD